MKRVWKEKSKGLSTSFGIAERVCRSMLRGLSQRQCVFKALLFGSIDPYKLQWSARRFVVEWSRAESPGGKTDTADVTRRIFINVCRNFRNVACLRHRSLCPVR